MAAGASSTAIAPGSGAVQAVEARQKVYEVWARLTETISRPPIDERPLTGGDKDFTFRRDVAIEPDHSYAVRHRQRAKFEHGFPVDLPRRQVSAVCPGRVGDGLEIVASGRPHGDLEVHLEGPEPSAGCRRLSHAGPDVRMPS